MARDFAKALYRSRSWEECREAYGASVFWICERCFKPGNTVHHKKHLTPTNVNDPEVALAFANLELLCDDCHAKEHHRGKHKARATREGFAFDENGDLVPAPSPHAEV